MGRPPTSRGILRKEGGGMLQGQVFLKGGQTLSLFKFFKVCHFYI